MKLKEATYFPDAEELTKFSFEHDVLAFIQQLIGASPLKARLSNRLKRFGFDEPKMISILTTPEIKGVPESAVIIRTEKIKSGGIDENGETQKDEFQVSYKVPKKDLQRGIKGVIEKLRNIYIKLFENHIVEGTILTEDEGCDGGAFGDMGENGGSSTFSLGAGGSYPYFDANALEKKKSGKQDEDKSTDFPIMRRDIYKVTESKKKIKRPIGRLTMFITEEQMKQLAQLIKEEAVMNTQAGDFGYDAPGFKTSGKDFFKGANDREDILSRRNPDNKAVGHIGESKSGIHIKKKNKGKFTATKKRTGKSTSELLHSPNKKTRARANFARMAKRGWKPLEESFDGGYTIETPSKWKHLKDKSSYNHNYYLNPNTGEIILEECDDDSYFEYFLTDKNLNIVKRIGEYYYDDYEGPGTWIWDSNEDITLY